MMRIDILNGPNLNLLGVREPHIYGHTTLAEIEALCAKAAARLGLEADFRQTNSEAQMIEWLHATRGQSSGIVINPAAWSFTSMAMLDALKASELPIVEIHISNIHRREPIYQKSLVSSVAVGVVCGLGPIGYVSAIEGLAEYLKKKAPAEGAAR